MNPYEELLKNKFGIQPTPAQPAQPKTIKTAGTPEAPGKEIPAPQPKQAKNPYDAVVQNTLATAQADKLQKEQDATQADINKTLNPGFFKSVWDTVKGMPKGAATIASNPKAAVLGLGTGMIDLGPSVVNGVLDIVSLVLPKQARENIQVNKLPLQGKKLREIIAYTQNETEQNVTSAVNEGTIQGASYELGNAAVKPVLGKTKFLADGTKVVESTASSRIVGDVAGGQLSVPENATGKDRALSALFDATFGIVGEGSSYLAKKAKPKPIPAEVAEFLPPGMADNAVEIPSESTNPFTAVNLDEKVGKVEYIPKRRLGVDENGQEIMARTSFDYATGNAIVEYSSKLDKPGMETYKKVALDHELGHVFDKRVNAGTNISAELPNYMGNSKNLEAMFTEMAQKLDDSVENVVAKLDTEIKALGGKQANEAEAFATAFSKYRADPEGVAREFPTFHTFLDQVPVEGRFASRTTSVGELAARASKVDPDAEKKLVRDSVVTVGDKRYRLTGSTKDDYVTMKRDFETSMQAINAGAGDDTYKAKIKKTLTNEFQSKVRTLTGNYSPAELTQQLKKESANYPGKRVLVEINGKDVPGKIDGKAQFGNYKVILDDGSSVSNVPALRIKDPRSKQEILNTITSRKGVQLFDDSVQNPQTGATSNKAQVKKNVTEKNTNVTNKNTGLEGGTGLDSGKRISGRAGINLDKVNASNDVKDLIKKIDDENGNFSAQRMSKSMDSIDDMARLVGLSKEDLMAAKPGSIVNTETLRKARQMVLDQAEDLANYLKTFNTADATADQLRIMREKYETLVAMQKAVAGYSSEAGTLLNSLKRPVTPGENVTLAQLADQLKGMGIEDAEQLANGIGKKTTLTPIGKKSEKFFQAWYAAILSGPKTATRNIISNVGNLLTNYASKFANPRQWKEIPAASRALLAGFKEGTPKFAKDLRDIIRGKSKIDVSDGKFFDATDPTRPQVWGDKVHAVFEAVGKSLAASDEFVSGIAQKMEQASLDKVYSKEMSEALRKTMSMYYGEKVVYHGMPKSNLARGVMESAEVLRRRVPATRVIIPFVRTVANFIDNKIDYIPVVSYFRRGSFFEDQVKEIERMTATKFSKQEAELVKTRLRDQAIGKAAFGTAIAGAAIGFAAEGNISGNGPSNYQERLQLQRTGWRPNSIKIGDTWVPYVNLGPLAGLFSMVGNIHDAKKYDGKGGESAAEMIGLGFLGWMQSELNSSFMQGTSKLLDAIANRDERYFTQELPISLIPVPALITQTRDLFARQQYETYGIVDKLRDKLGLEGSVFGLDPLQERLDAFGEPMRADVIFGVSPSREKASLIDQFLIANDLVVTVPLKTQKYTDPVTEEKTELTPEEYNEYVKTSGRRIYEELEYSIPGFEGLQMEDKQKAVKDIVNDIRKEIREDILYKRERKEE